MDALKSALVVGLGSFCGGALRYLTAVWLDRRTGNSLLGILAVNLIGSFAIGFAAMWFGRMGWGTESRAPLFWTAGLLGGYTTFSTFSMQTLRLVEGGQLGMAALNAVGSVLGCVFAAWMGLRLGQAAFG